MYDIDRDFRSSQRHLCKISSQEHFVLFIFISILRLRGQHSACVAAADSNAQPAQRTDENFQAET